MKITYSNYKRLHIEGHCAEYASIDITTKKFLRKAVTSSVLIASDADDYMFIVSTGSYLIYDQIAELKRAFDAKPFPNQDH